MVLAALASISANGWLSAWTARRVIWAAALRARAQRLAGGGLWGLAFGAGLAGSVFSVRIAFSNRCLWSFLRRVSDAVSAALVGRDGRTFDALDFEGGDLDSVGPTPPAMSAATTPPTPE
jgi:hypothetical protein